MARGREDSLDYWFGEGTPIYADPVYTDPLPSEWDGIGDTQESQQIGWSFDGALDGFDLHYDFAEDATTVEGIVITGSRPMDPWEISLIMSLISPVPIVQPWVSFIEWVTGDDPPLYTVMDEVGDTPCDADDAWEGLLNNAAPGQTGPAITGNIVNVPGLGPVIQTVDPDTMSVTNTTLPDHELHPGTVTRTVVVQNGSVYIQTTGTGTGALGGGNILGSGALWGYLDAQIAAYVDANDDGEGDC